MRHPIPFSRALNVILGIWLIASAFLWPHSDVERGNALISGVLCALFALFSMRYDGARYLTAALAIWVLVSGWAIPAVYVTTIWNNVLVAMAIFIVSLLPIHEARRAPTRPG